MEKRATTFINLLVVILLVFSGKNAHSQSPYLPLNHWAYDFLERMETKHVIGNVLNDTKPLSRREFATYLQAINNAVKQGVELNKVEREQLAFLSHEFREEFPDQVAVPGNYHPRIEKIKTHPRLKKFFPDFLYGNNRNFWSWGEDQIQVFFDPVYRYRAGYRRSDSTDQAANNFHFTNGFQIWGYVDKYLGFFVDVRDNKQWGTEEYRIGNYTLPGLGFVRATSPDFIYHDETEAYLKLGIKNFQLIYGKFKNYWGAGSTGSLILSDYATSYDQFKFEFNHKHFKFTSIYAYLIDYHYQLEDRLQQRKYFAAHRLEIAPWRWLTLGLSELVLFKGRSFEPSYLNPIMFFRSAEHYLGSPDNVMMAFDYKFTAIKNIKIYGELLIDDITTSRLGTGWYGNKYGFISGIFFAEPFKINNLDLRMEYVRIRPYVYTHENALQFTHYNTSLGHWIGPNSDLRSLVVSYRLSRRLKFDTRYSCWRHGANSGDVNFGGDINHYFEETDHAYVEFLSGIRETRQQVGFSVSYELMRNLFFNVTLYKHMAERALLNGTVDKSRELSFSGSLGINY